MFEAVTSIRKGKGNPCVLICTVGMDVCEPEQALQKQSAVSTKRLPLLPADNKNGATRQVRTREVSSRYRSPTPSAATGPRRCPSPNASGSSPSTTALATKRATSTERKHPSRPSPPPSPSTPIEDTSPEMLQASRKMAGHRLPQSLWPSTMRSLSVSFQSDSFSIHTSKREKPVSHVPSDHTAKLLSNVAHRQAEISATRRSTPERKRSPYKGKNSANLSENSKPINSLHPHPADQHRWPGRTSENVSTPLDISTNLADKTRKPSPISRSGTGTPSFRKLDLDGTIKPLQKSTNDLLMLISRDEYGKDMLDGCSDDGSSLQMQKPSCSSSSDRTKLANAAPRALSSSTPGSRPALPSVSRGARPSRAKAVNPSRRTSPALVRPSSSSREPQNSTSVLSFIVDLKKGKKAANHIEDVHQLRMLFNRHLQWRYANARSDAVVLQSQKIKAEKMLHGVQMAIGNLWDSIMEKRINLLQMKLKLNLYSVLNNQLTSLNEWASVEMDHSNALTWAIQDLQSSTIRIPVTGGARVDIETVKAAVCSAVDVMQTMGSSVCSILSRVESVNHLVSELADVAAQERALLDECETILGSTAALQVEEYSLRTHLLQTKRG